MTRIRPLWLVVSVVALGALPLCAQNVISAKSGLIHFVSGEVRITNPTGEPMAAPVVDARRGQFPTLPEGGILETGQGRAEVLMSPGVFLRMSDRSSFELVNNSLEDTRIRLRDGLFLLEVAEFDKKNAIHVQLGKAVMEVRDDGLYRFDADPPSIHVFDGKVRVFQNDEETDVKKGKYLNLDGTMTKVAKFDRNQTDSFYAWSQNRAERITLANMASARQMARGYTGWGASSMGFNSSRWLFSPYFGMFTFIPRSGIIYSPFGFQYWSPYAVYSTFIAPPRPIDPWGGGRPSYRTIGPTSRGMSGTVRSAGPSMGAPRSTGSAPIGRSSGGAGGRAR